MLLESLVAYDRWANHQWLEYLETLGSPAEETAVFAHHLAASQMWASRFACEHPTQLPTVVPSRDLIDSIAATWSHVVRQGTDRDLTFRRFNGEEVTSSAESIIVHVANHGTYHRGELRGLCRAAGREDFPETDFFWWDRLGRP